MKLVRRIWFVCFVTFLPIAVFSAADTWEITVVDTEGGKAIVMLTPDGESMLVDAGFPGNNDRDTKRIVAAAEELKIKQFDYIFTIYQSLCFPSAVYPVLAQGGKYDERIDPFSRRQQ